MILDPYRTFRGVVEQVLLKDEPVCKFCATHQSIVRLWIKFISVLEVLHLKPMVLVVNISEKGEKENFPRQVLESDRLDLG